MRKLETIRNLVVTGVTALVFLGCPASDPFEVHGTYRGSASIALEEGETLGEAPLVIRLKREWDGTQPSNMYTGTVAVELTTGGGDALAEALGLSDASSLDFEPALVTGEVEPSGLLRVFTPDVFSDCEEEICLRMVLSGQGADANGNLFMDQYDGTWAGLIWVGEERTPVSGTFTTDRVLF